MGVQFKSAQQYWNERNAWLKKRSTSQPNPKPRPQPQPKNKNAAGPSRQNFQSMPSSSRSSGWNINFNLEDFTIDLDHWYYCSKRHWHGWFLLCGRRGKWNLSFPGTTFVVFLQHKHFHFVYSEHVKTLLLCISILFCERQEKVVTTLCLSLMRVLTFSIMGLEVFNVLYTCDKIFANWQTKWFYIAHLLHDLPKFWIDMGL